jgi:hypothetical protein
MKEGKARLGGMERPGPLEHRRGLGKTSLLQPDGANKGHELVAQAARQQWLHKLVGGRKVTGLEEAPALCDG